MLTSIVLFQLFDEDNDGYIDTVEVKGVKKQFVATALFLHADSDPEEVSEVGECSLVSSSR